MRIGFVSDSHGNPAGLTECLRALKSLEAESIWCLGDIVGYGSEAQDCLDLVREYCDGTLLGNHDAVVAGRMNPVGYHPEVAATLQRARQEMSPEALAWLHSLPMEKYLSLDGFLIALTHAHPSDPHGWCYYSQELHFSHPASHEGQTVLCLYGHTHRPMLQHSSAGGEREHMKETQSVILKPRTRETWIANTGSCGQPRDGDPRAACILFDTRSGELMFLRVAYDIAATQNLFRSRGVPAFLIQRLTYGM